jgi:hypothetical protein
MSVRNVDSNTDYTERYPGRWQHLRLMCENLRSYCTLSRRAHKPQQASSAAQQKQVLTCRRYVPRTTVRRKLLQIAVSCYQSDKPAVIYICWFRRTGVLLIDNTSEHSPSAQSCVTVTGNPYLILHLASCRDPWQAYVGSLFGGGHWFPSDTSAAVPSASWCLWGWADSRTCGDYGNVSQTKVNMQKTGE